jgi:formylglycine-generating enzyme required for sulfatase activity
MSNKHSPLTRGRLSFPVILALLVWAQILSVHGSSFVPRVLDYQGRLIPDASSSLPADGTAWFKFAFADQTGQVILSNDGSPVDLSTPGSDEPVAPVELAVAADGYFTTTFDFSPQNLLGGAVLADVAEGLRLHVWYSDDWDPVAETGTFTKLVNGQPLNAVPFALRAAQADVATTAQSAALATTALSADALASASLTETMLDAGLTAKLAKLDNLDALATRLQAIESAASPYYVALPSIYVDSLYQVQAGQTLNVPIQADFTSHMRIVAGPQGAAFSNAGPFRLIWSPSVSDTGLHTLTVQAENVFSSTFSQTAISVIVSPEDMAYIPAGTFLMGRGDDGTAVDDPDQTPTRTVALAQSYFMDQFETTHHRWHTAIAQMKIHQTLSSLYTGFEANNEGVDLTNPFPITRKSWIKVVVWCNILSELEGLVPAYYLDDSYSSVLRDSTIDPRVTEIYMNQAASGYRLPTEAEWEYAARGGLVQNKYPWGNQEPNQALVNGDNFVGYAVENDPSLYPAFGYGLYHMSGNVREWVWDWYDSDYYSLANSVTNPLGPSLANAEETFAFGKSKVARSNSFTAAASYLTVYYRDYRNPTVTESDIGFRTVRTVTAQ